VNFDVTDQLPIRFIRYWISRRPMTQVAEENIWAEEGAIGRRLEKTA
jgi:hypothetical protein